MPQVNSRFLRVFLPQLFAVGLLVFAFTGGIPFLDYRYLKPHPDLKRFVYFGCWIAGGGLAAFFYLSTPKTGNAMEPAGFIRSFFSLPAAGSVGVLYAAYVVTQICSLWFAQAALETAVWDLGFFDQVLWNTALGDFMITSVRGGFHVYTEHFKPILIFVAQLYKVIPSITALFALNAAVSALSIAGIYLVAKRITLSHSTALTFAFCLFFYAPLRNGINFPFHSQTLADPLLLFGFYFLLIGRCLPAYFFLLLAMMCKQNIILAVLGIGFFALHQRWRGGGIVIAGALLYLALYLGFVEPNYRYVLHFRDKWTFFNYLVSGNPEGWQKLLEPNPVVFLARITGPFLFLTFFCRGWPLLAGPLLMMHLLSSYEGLRNTSAHYTAGLNALLIISSVYGFLTAEKWLSAKAAVRRGLDKIRISPGFALRCLLFLVSAFFFTFPQLFDVQRNMALASRPEYQDARRVMASLPSEFSVLASERFAPHLSHRRYLFVFYSMFKGAPYEALGEQPDLIVVDKERVHDVERKLVEKFSVAGYRRLLDRGIVEIYSRPGLELPKQTIEVWKKSASAQPVDFLSAFKIIFSGVYAVILLFMVLLYFRAAARAMLKNSSE